MEELKILSYFASFNHISKKIALREKSLIKYLGNRWTKYSPEQQEELLNDLYVPYSIRQLYPSKASDKEGNEKMKVLASTQIIVRRKDYGGRKRCNIIPYTYNFMQPFDCEWHARFLGEKDRYACCVCVCVQWLVHYKILFILHSEYDIFVCSRQSTDVLQLVHKHT